jgi:hypothetical protein
MNDEQLRQRLARLDPLDRVGDAGVEPVTSPSARALLEDIVNTPVTDSPDTRPTPFDLEPRRPRTAWWKPLGAAAALVAVVAVGVVALTRGDDDDQQVAEPPATTAAPGTQAPPGTEPGKLKVLELSAGVEDTMAMCMQITPEAVAQMQVAFKGTATAVEGELVTLTIDQIYTGTDAQVATLVAPPGMEALIGGIQFEVGQQYFVTAFDGVVNYCGFSGPVTPELQAIFDQAFPAA